MEVSQQDLVDDNSKNNFKDNSSSNAYKTYENSPNMWPSNNITLEHRNAGTKEKCIISTLDNLQHILLESDGKIGKNENNPSDIKEVTLSSGEISEQFIHLNSQNESLKLRDSKPDIPKSLDKFESNLNHVFKFTQPIGIETNIVNDSIKQSEKEIGESKSQDKLENDQDCNELELNANPEQLSKGVNLEKECTHSSKSKTKMTLQNENLSSYRYIYSHEYDSWSEDDESSSTSTSSDTSSGSDFLQMVVESSSGPKNIPEIKTKGELGLDDLPPIEELSIEIPKEDMMLIGKIHAIVEKLVVVHAIKDMKPLDIDSVLFLDHNKPLGRIYDVFGPVVEPFYCVRFNTVEQIDEKVIVIGANVFFAPEKNDITSYVFVDQLQKEKGSDASWRHNNEPPEECLDFSDDEQEREARRKRMNKNRNQQFSSSFDTSVKRPYLASASNAQQYLTDRLTATRFSTFSSSHCLSYPPHNPSPSVIEVQRLAPFSMFPSQTPPSPSPIKITKIIPFSSSYASQPPPSPSISVAAGQNFSPFLNAHPSHPPSSSVFTAQGFNPFSNPPPPVSPAAPRFTPFSNSYPCPPPPSPPVLTSSRFTSSSNYYARPPPPPPPPLSPVFPPSRFNPFSSSYPTCPPPSSSIAVPAFNPFSSPHPAYIRSPSPSFSPSNSNVVAELKLPLFTPQNALQRHPNSSPNFLPYSVNHTTPSSQHCATPIFSPQQQHSFSPQIAMQRPAPPPQHLFGQVTLMNSLPPLTSMPPPVNPWNNSPTTLTENVKPNTDYMYEPM